MDWRLASWLCHDLIVMCVACPLCPQTYSWTAKVGRKFMAPRI